MLRNFNQGDWVAATMLARRLLEGLLKKVIVEEGKAGDLNKQIEKLPEHVKANETLVTLAHKIREVGNLGAHFDNNAQPDERLADSTLNLLDYFIEFVFILPSRIEGLTVAVNNLQPDNTSAMNDSTGTAI